MSLLGKVIEEGTITLSGASSGTHSFSASFSTTPNVVLSVNNTGEVFAVTAVVSSVSKTSFSIKTSASMTGEIQFRAVGS